jgi:hypothetical protein
LCWCRTGHGTGTNALIVDAAAGIEFKFGDGSRAR